ncbi:MAG: PKD domain-containing protein [Clostridiales bacterium]|nr:PKD domain-containing protein [Clostridiales bacterium]
MMNSFSKSGSDRNSGLEKCSGCGAGLREGARFCPSCGKENIPQRITQSRKKLMILLGAVIIFLAVVGILGIPRLLNAPDQDLIDSDNSQLHDVSISQQQDQQPNYSLSSNTGIKEITGQFYAGRALNITGQGFGQYDIKSSRVTIDGKEAIITTWGDTHITVIVPKDVTEGEKVITLNNPAVFNEISTKASFSKTVKKEVSRTKISPDHMSVIKGSGFEIFITEGSVSKEQELVVYKLEEPCSDDSPYYSVTDEFEITDGEGNHVFFNFPAVIMLDVEDMEEAMSTTVQYFDEALGVWVVADTGYNIDEGKLYVKTTHFSSWRRFRDSLKKVVSKQIDSAVDAGKKVISFPYTAGKFVADKVVDLGVHTYINDVINEEFIGVDDNEHVIVYYRVSDAKKDPGLPDKAKEMAAAFSVSYEAYSELFGWQNMPNSPKFIAKDEGFYETYIKGLTSYTGPKSITIDAEYGWVANPLKVYLDPNYNAKCANYSIVSGNISMPSDYPKDNMAATCAHELFHAVQHEQLGMKQLYMANGFKDIAKEMQSSENEVHKYLANNNWYLEATAEYASRFIGTNIGISSLHDGTFTNLPYFAFNGSHEYGMSSFLDYIITDKYSSTADRGSGFKKMWDYVLNNYSMLLDINTAFDSYTKENNGRSAQLLYEDFWRDAVTRGFMPLIPPGEAGIADVVNFKNATKYNSLQIQARSVGVLRFDINEKAMTTDETAIHRSIWFENSETDMNGEVYRLNGLEMSDRAKEEIKPIGYVSPKEDSLRAALVPYSKGDSFALITFFKGLSVKGYSFRVKPSVTTVKWENQEDILKKLKNTTLSIEDKLEFTPLLPLQKAADSPYTAVIILNDDADFVTELDKVENGKSFKVGPPMHQDSSLPPSRIKINIRIFKEGVLVHEYQSADMDEVVQVRILEPRNKVYELNENVKEIEHEFSATATPKGDYRFVWNFNDGSKEQSTQGSDSMVKHIYNKAGKYSPSVTLYDNNQKEIGKDSVQVTLTDGKVTDKEMEKPAGPSPDVIQTLPSSGKKEYAWVSAGTQTNDWQSALDKYNTSKVWQHKINASAGSATFTNTYIGPDGGGWLKPGMSQTGKVSWGEPSARVIRAGDIITLDMGATHVSHDHKNQAGIGSVVAYVLKFDAAGKQKNSLLMATKDGISTFASSVSNNYGEMKGTVIAKIEGGSSEGDTMGISVSASNGNITVQTTYMFEWKAQ